MYEDEDISFLDGDNTKRIEVDINHLLDEYDFYGVVGNCYKIGDLVLEAIEDPDDGYRSYYGKSAIVMDTEGLVFSKTPFDKVRLREYHEASTDTYGQSDEINGWVLESVEDGHVWLIIGTDNSCNYYPYFVFRYQPREPK